MHAKLLILTLIYGMVVTIGGIGGPPIYAPYHQDMGIGGSSAEIECYNCLQPDGNCFEGECRGLSCFKIKGYRNGQWLTYKGCMYQFAAPEFREGGCREGAYNGIQGYICHCSNRRYCNSVTKHPAIIQLVLPIVITVLLVNGTF